MLKLFRYLKPWTPHVILSLILLLAQVLAELLMPTMMASILDQGVARGDTAWILRTGLVMLGLTIGSLVLATAGSWLSSTAGTGMGKAIRATVFRTVSTFSLDEFDKVGTASLITRSTNDVTQVQSVTFMLFRMLIMAPLMAIGGVAMAWSRDPELTVTLAVAVPLVLLLVVAALRTATPLFKAIQSKVDAVNLVLREGLTGIRVIRAFDRTGHEEERFDRVNLDLTSLNLKVNRLMSFVMPAMMLMMNLTTVAILWFGAGRIGTGAMEVGSLVAFTQYAAMILFSLLMMSMLFIMLPRAQAAAERINEVLAVSATEAGDRGGYVSGAREHSAGTVDPLPPHRGPRLEFRNVRFTYHGAESPALSDISFVAEAGSTVAIIGSTGAGKSSLAKLLPRFYAPDSGSILLDGVDIGTLDTRILRQGVGFVPQKPLLFAGTIAQNLRTGKAEASDADLVEAARVAQASDFLASFADGLEHEVQQGGANLSGGQKQRLSIARALVRKPGLYVLDDSFSALDFATDAALRRALRQYAKGATFLIIAQRVGTIMDADQIIVLEDGRIAGKGIHAELMATCPVYREIAESQNGQEARS